MKPIRLNDTWSRLMDRYRDDHQHPLNEVCHTVGIPLIAGSIPVGATIVGLPLAAGMFTVGWGFQFAGHAIEGKEPSFVHDRRALLCGLIWWLQRVGVPMEETGAPEAGASAEGAGPTAEART